MTKSFLQGIDMRPPRDAGGGKINASRVVFSRTVRAHLVQALKARENLDRLCPQMAF